MSQKIYKTLNLILCVCLSAGVAALFSACGEDGGNSAIPENVISVSTYSGTYPEADHSFEAVDEVVREIYISDAKGDYELALPYPASAYTVTFEGCHELTDITVDGRNVLIESFSVRNCEKLKTVTFRTRGGEVADMEFVNTGDLSEILLPEGTRTINGLRLDSCDGKTKIDFALSLSAVGSVEAFYCSDLREVAFSGGAESVGSLTVFGSDAVKCTISGLVGKFDNLQIRDFAALKTAFVSVTSENIVNCEFINCSVLNAVVIGGDVEHIGWLGIRDCPSVAAVCFDKTSAVAEQKVDMIKDRERDFPKIYVYGTTASSGDVWYADENGNVVLVNGGDEATEMTFSIYWGINGRSFYDSASGELVKDVFADAEIYATILAFTDAQKKTVSDALSSLNVDAYPNVYAPYPDGEATLVPPYTVILKVGKKQIKCDVDGWISEDEKGQRFLTAVKNIIDVIVGSEEWKALPDYEPMD